MDSDNEENYFTRRENGAIKDEDVDKAISDLKILANYDKGKHIFIAYSQSNAYDIQILLNELKYREAKYNEVLNSNNSLIQSSKKWKDRFDKSINKLEKKNRIIDKLLTEITAVNSGRYEYMDNDEVLEIFTKKAEE